MSTIKNIAIIQARTGATRLPNKVLLKLTDKTVLEHVVNRVKKSKYIDELLVATTIEKNDLQIVEICSRLGIRVFCGSQDDVLDRYYQAARLFDPENVVRITADCPLIDPLIIDQIIEEHEKGDYDYTSNIIRETFPDGLDVEIMKFKVLEEAWKEAKLRSQREHVTQYILHNDKYRKGSIESDTYLGDKRWTLDTAEDYAVISRIYQDLYPANQDFQTLDVLKYLETHKDVEEMNKKYGRNEGLRKSIENDYEIN